MRLLVLCCVQFLNHLNYLLPRQDALALQDRDKRKHLVGMADYQFFHRYCFFLGEFGGHHLSSFFGSTGDEAFSGCVVSELTSSIDSLGPSHIFP